MSAMAVLIASGKQEPLSLKELETDPSLNAKAYYWSILTSENSALRFSEETSKCEYFFIQDTPIYIRIFYEVIKKAFKKSLITINERLPDGDFHVVIFIRFDSEKARQAALRAIKQKINNSDNKNIDSKINFIITNDKDSFKQRLDEMINLTSGLETAANYSYCLCCGVRVKNGHKFCNAEFVHNKIHKDNCLFTTKYWIESRLGIKNRQENRAKREEFHEEMLWLVQKYPNSAFEHFKERNPQLFQAKKPGRKQKRKM